MIHTYLTRQLRQAELDRDRLRAENERLTALARAVERDLSQTSDELTSENNRLRADLAAQLERVERLVNAYEENHQALNDANVPLSSDEMDAYSVVERIRILATDLAAAERVIQDEQAQREHAEDGRLEARSKAAELELDLAAERERAEIAEGRLNREHNERLYWQRTGIEARERADAAEQRVVLAEAGAGAMRAFLDGEIRTEYEDSPEWLARIDAALAESAGREWLEAAEGEHEALDWALDLLDLYDKRLEGIDGAEFVYTPIHVAGKVKARAALARWSAIRGQP